MTLILSRIYPGVVLLAHDSSIFSFLRNPILISIVTILIHTLSVVYKGSLLPFILSSSYSCILDNGHSGCHEMKSQCSLNLHSSVEHYFYMIIGHLYLFCEMSVQFICHLWIGCLVCWCYIFWVFYIFWILIFCWKSGWQRFSSHSVGSLLMFLFPSLCRSFLTWCSLLVSTCHYFLNYWSLRIFNVQVAMTWFWIQLYFVVHYWYFPLKCSVLWKSCFQFKNKFNLILNLLWMPLQKSYHL